MLSTFLVPETEQRANGQSETIALGEAQGKLLRLTLGITRIIEQESLDIAILGSAGGGEFGAKPVMAFPQKFYCGTYTIQCDLAKHPEITHLRVAWKMSRWGRGKPTPIFGFYVFAEQAAGVTASACPG